MSRFPGIIFIMVGIAFLAAGIVCLQKTDQERELKAALQEKASLPTELHKVRHTRAEQELAWEIRAKRIRTVACVTLSLLLFGSGILVIKWSFYREKVDRKEVTAIPKAAKKGRKKVSVSETVGKGAAD